MKLLCLFECLFLLVSCVDRADIKLRDDFNKWRKDTTSDVFSRMDADGKWIVVSRIPLIEKDGALVADIASQRKTGGLWLYPGGTQTESYNEAFVFLSKCVGKR